MSNLKWKIVKIIEYHKKKKKKEEVKVENKKKVKYK